jgi:hypothetical protein
MLISLIPSYTIFATILSVCFTLNTEWKFITSKILVANSALLWKPSQRVLSHGLEVGLLKNILELFLVSPLSNKFGTCISPCRTVDSIFIMSLSVLAVVRDPLLHKKLASIRNLETGFPLHYSVSYWRVSKCWPAATMQTLNLLKIFINAQYLCLEILLISLWKASFCFCSVDGFCS